MYEDRFKLYVLCNKKCENRRQSSWEENWWRIAFGKPNVPTPNYVNISLFSLPTRSMKELRALIA
jgi:hypothetical protein